MRIQIQIRIQLQIWLLQAKKKSSSNLTAGHKPGILSPHCSSPYGNLDKLVLAMPCRCCFHCCFPGIDHHHQQAKSRAKQSRAELSSSSCSPQKGKSQAPECRSFPSPCEFIKRQSTKLAWKNKRKNSTNLSSNRRR